MSSNRRPLERSTLELAVHMFDGIFTALMWIENGNIDGPPEREIMNAQANLILAGRQLAEEIGERL